MRTWLIIGVGCAWATGLVVVPSAARAAKAASMADCFHDLEFGTSPEIVCEFPLQPSLAERAEIEKQTAGYLKNATCTVSIRITRALVTAAVETPDYEFDAPPQPVACNVMLPGKVDKANPAAVAPDIAVPIKGTFAPHVSIKGGVAVKANPGLGNIGGVPQLFSIPVAAYINRAGFLREGMLRTVNAWMVHLKAAKARGR